MADGGGRSRTDNLRFLGVLSAIPGLAVVVLDLWTYWWHRANHRWTLLWRFHRVHHSDSSMDVTTAVRFHLGELLISAGLRLALITLLGLPLAALLLYDGAVTVATQFHHANIGLGRWDRWIRRLIVSPNMHKIHHSKIRAETNSNYSTVLSLWDRAFSTYRDRDDCHAIRFGVPRMTDESFQTLKGLALTPFRRL
jgi:sterol desaturase/sphingolipid hydroxylase (fatty acid hydroxylase superfamily)